MRAFVCAGAGFLLAVVWFDLMFDVQALRRGGGDVPEEVLDSMARYYRRVTTDAHPMNRLVAAVMAATLGAVAMEIARGGTSRWTGWSSLALVGAAVGVAAVHTVPSAVRLGSGRGPVGMRSRLARAVLREHLLVAAALATVLAIQLAA